MIYLKLCPENSSGSVLRSNQNTQFIYNGNDQKFPDICVMANIADIDQAQGNMITSG